MCTERKMTVAKNCRLSRIAKINVAVTPERRIFKENAFLKLCSCPAEAAGISCWAHCHTVAEKREWTHTDQVQ